MSLQPCSEHSPFPMRRWFGYVLAVLVLLAVFALYTRPDFLVTLANQIWACF